MAQMFRFEFVGVEPLDLSLTRITHWLSDMKPVWEEVRVELEKHEQAEFAAEGPGWAPLKEATILRRGSDHPILVNSGALKESFSEGGSGNVFDPSPQSMSWGSDVPYGVFHQTGTDNMVARPLFDRSKLREAVGTGMHRAAHELGLLWGGG